MSVEFIIDNREHIQQEILAEIPRARVEKLDVGDFIFTIDGDVIIVVERKTTSDYASSIKDGRNREQKNRLLATYAPNQILYLVEGNLTKNNSSFKYNKVSKETIVSSIVNTLFRDGIHVFHTSNTTETVDFLRMIYIKLEKQKLEWKKSSTTPHEDIVNSIKKQKKANLTKDVCFQAMLNCIPNVSNKISERIIQDFPTMNMFIFKLNEFSTSDEKEEFIINLKVNGRKIPRSTAKNVINFLI